MSPLKISLIAAAGLAVLAGCYLGSKSALAKMPEEIGPQDGILKPCPTSPNCVCSQDEAADKQIAPIAFEGNPAEAMVRLRKIIEDGKRTTIVTAEDNYIHAEYRSAIFRFVDDVEFLLVSDAPTTGSEEDGGVIHVRSASRTGHSDLGVNRKRVEAIRAAFSSE